MARKMKGSAKFIITLLILGGLFLVVKYTGLWDKLTKDSGPSTSTVPVIDDIAALPGTKEIRLGHWTWNSHQAWSFANNGKNTSQGSIFKRNGLTVRFVRIEDIP
ncbi:MAG: hypothetical protein OEZ36_00085, partial [Spirochaetota bacterium]|nr:hypothetical protein [Spirochaetota bacterium]